MVRPVPIMATAASSLTPSGMGWRAANPVTASSAYPPLAMPRWATTRVPEQGRIGARADLVDDARDLAARAWSAGRGAGTGRR